MADFGAIWVPAAAGNFDVSRAPVNLIVDHHTASTLDGALARFTLAGAAVSAHFIVDRDGKVYQCVDLAFTAYHSGDYQVNQRSVGIEHVSLGPAGEPDAFTDVQYAASADLHGAIGARFGFPLDPAHVWPHNRVVPTDCPGSLDLARLMRARGADVLVVKTNDQGDPLSQGVWFVDASGKRLVTAAEWNASQQVGMRVAILPLSAIKAIPDSPRGASLTGHVEGTLQIT